MLRCLQHIVFTQVDPVENIFEPTSLSLAAASSIPISDLTCDHEMLLILPLIDVVLSADEYGILAIRGCKL